MDFREAVNILSAKAKNGFTLEALLNGGRLRVKSDTGATAAELSAALNVCVLTLGTTGFDGNLRINNASGKPAIIISGRDGDIILNDESGKQAVRVSGPLGDVILSGADAAEDFEISEADAEAAPGTVMVIDSDGKLAQSSRSYDSRVAGVISGAGQYRPGLILGRTQGQTRRRPIALVGRVCCQVTADEAPIEIGDLLTSSPIVGHAMKAVNVRLSHGAILGKALATLGAGQGEVPILVSLQ